MVGDPATLRPTTSEGEKEKVSSMAVPGGLAVEAKVGMVPVWVRSSEINGDACKCEKRENREGPLVSPLRSSVACMETRMGWELPPSPSPPPPPSTGDGVIGDCTDEVSVEEKEREAGEILGADKGDGIPSSEWGRARDMP